MVGVSITRISRFTEEEASITVKELPRRYAELFKDVPNAPKLPRPSFRISRIRQSDYRRRLFRTARTFHRILGIESNRLCNVVALRSMVWVTTEKIKTQLDVRPRCPRWRTGKADTRRRL